MNNHKFRVGQIVGFSSQPRQDAPVLTRDFKVLQLLRHSSGECAYRVKTITEAFARIAKEGEICLARSGFRLCQGNFGLDGATLPPKG
jgi:hypothetical protein